MSKNTDRYLKNALKNWANSQPPPRNGKARLLWTAAHPAETPKSRAAAIVTSVGNLLSSEPNQTVTQAVRIFSWATVYTFQNRFASLRLIV